MLVGLEYSSETSLNPYPSKSVYAIEATVHAPTWEGVYGEIMKVLKPGGVVCLLIDLQDAI
jgi:hypothetical protein